MLDFLLTYGGILLGLTFVLSPISLTLWAVFR